MVDDLDPQSCSHARLRQLTRKVTAHFDHHLQGTGISNAQFALLSHIMAQGPAQPGILARQMQMDASTLTRNVQPLVAKGWLVMDKGHDARSRLVHITAAGLIKRAEAQHHWKKAQRAISASLGAQHLADLHALLDNCTQCLQDSGQRSGNDGAGAGVDPSLHGQTTSLHF